MSSDSESQPSVPRLSVVPVCYGCKARLGSWPRCGRALLAAYPPGSSQAPAKGPRKVADAIVASMAAQRRPQQGAVWCAPDPGLGGCCRNSREAAASPCRRAYCGARSEPCRAAGGLLPVRLLAAAADLAADGVRTRQAQVAGKRILTRPRGAILLPAMAGGAWRGNSAVYVGTFCGNEEEGCRAPFQGPAEAGYRAKQDMRKPDYMYWTGRGPYIQLRHTPDPGNSQWEIRAEGSRGPFCGFGAARVWLMANTIGQDGPRRPAGVAAAQRTAGQARHRVEFPLTTRNYELLEEAASRAGRARRRPCSRGRHWPPRGAGQRAGYAASGKLLRELYPRRRAGAQNRREP